MGAEIPHNRPGRILIVTDDVTTARDLENQVMHLGYSVCAVVASGEKALDEIDKSAPDLVLMDTILDGDLDGIETANAMFEHQQVPVILLMTYAEERTVQHATLAGPLEFIVKPYTQQDLSIAFNSARHPETARAREAEATLWASDEKLRTIIETAPDAMVITDGQGTVWTFNPAAERLFGYRADEVLGRNISGLIPGAVRSEQETGVAEPQETSGSRLFSLCQVLDGRRKGGEAVTLEVATAEWISDQRRYITNIIRDTTHRKAMEGELKLRNGELARANARLDQFAYIIAHDLRTPLRAFRNTAQWLIEDLSNNPSDEIRAHIDRIAENSARMSVMLDDLLEYSRIGQEHTEPQTINLPVEIAQIQKDISGDVDVKITEIGPLKTVVAQRAALRIVLRNLIENAIHHAARDAVSIAIRCHDEEHHLAFEVSDDGPGIAPEYHEKIFMPFIKLSERRDSQGTGMGLTLVKRIIEINGGTIEVVSFPAERRGTSFQFKWKKGQ